MSFVCDHCRRVVTSDRRKVNEGRTCTVQRVVKPVRVVTVRYTPVRVGDVGQVKREENWCHACARDEEARRG